MFITNFIFILKNLGKKVSCNNNKIKCKKKALERNVMYMENMERKEFIKD